MACKPQTDVFLSLVLETYSHQHPSLPSYLYHDYQDSTSLTSCYMMTNTLVSNCRQVSFWSEDGITCPTTDQLSLNLSGIRTQFQ